MGCKNNIGFPLWNQYSKDSENEFLESMSKKIATEIDKEMIKTVKKMGGIKKMKRHTQINETLEYIKNLKK